MNYQKIQKAFNRIRHIRNTMDILEYENGIFLLKGWIYAENAQISNLKLVINSKNKKYTFEIKSGLERVDVYQFYRNENAKKSGFYGRVVVENIGDFSVYLMYCVGKHSEKMWLGKFHSELSEDKPIVKIENNVENGFDLMARIDANKNWKFDIPEKYMEQTIDVIVPVYNGYDFLDTLFRTILNTKMKYQLHIIDDCSTDERVYPFLEAYAASHDNVFLYQNEENLGFVKTVNRGFEACKHHVAIVNTDVELPENWLERLMYPILTDEKTASSTPYTNCGTNCSFPNYYKDNEIFLGLSVQEIDDEFLTMRPNYEKMPTGVGFCMGMNRNVLANIGFFDEESFGKGYGEENDWCQRAIKAGYKNVQVENLFVYHKHGGSFQSEDKKRFVKEHEKILLKKHPSYNKEVSRYYIIDPNREIRMFAALQLILKHRDLYNILAFDHNVGGGATAYLEGRRKTEVKKGNAFTIVRYDENEKIYVVLFYYEEHGIRFFVRNTENLFNVLEQLKIREIWMNELLKYPSLYKCLNEITALKKRTGALLKMFLHDFYCVCPTVNLLDHEGVHCFVKEGEECNECLRKVKTLQYMDYESMEAWRGAWSGFFNDCDEIIAFSDNSRQIFEKAFGEKEQLKVVPHVIDYISKIEKKFKTTDTLNIGLLGVLANHKGLSIIKELINLIEKRKLNIRIVLIGSALEPISSPVFKETGAYTRDMIPRLVFENDIDVFLISSIWPETFSYTTEEIMQMGMPIMSFDIGAPADRIKRYEKGQIIPEISAESIIETVERSVLIEECCNKKKLDSKVLFVIEGVKFSTRYRVDHLREQLLYKGITSDFVLIDHCAKKDLREYSAIVVYRCSKDKIIGNLVKKAHEFGKKVFYDIDDYIFEYDKIAHLDFLKGSNYTEFESFSSDVKRTMELCDGYIVSTNNLKEVLDGLYPNKPTYINRNAASMEMVTISMGIKPERKNDEIVLGYFSGTKTHDKDFEQIRDVLIRIMNRNSNVKLLIGGRIDISKEFNCFKNRIETFEFVEWKKLPKLIAQADVNLMPLEDTLFHACKSENKWMEAALVNVPTIASWNTELANAIVSGETGFLCKNEEEWEKNLQELIDDSELRNRLADHAKEIVLEKYTTKELEKDVLEVLS